MDIMELGAIGELVGGVAVIASLLYVGLQVRQTNQINRAESVRAFVRRLQHVPLQASRERCLWSAAGWMTSQDCRMATKPSCTC